MYFSYYWVKIPFRWRVALYSLPLFLQWLLAFYVERELSALKYARFALGFFLFFLTGILISLALYITAGFTGKAMGMILYQTCFWLQSFLGGFYFTISLIVSCEAFLNRGKIFSALRLDIFCYLVNYLEEKIDKERSY